MQQNGKSLLSEHQRTIIGQLVDKHQIPPKYTKVLIKYYTHFRVVLKFQNLSPILSKNLAQTALIFTQKSNFYRTLQGHQLPGICFSMNDILKSKSYQEIKNLISLCKQILERVKFKQMILKTEVQKLMNQVQQGLEEAIMFEKLCWVFFRNTLQTQKQAQSYKQKLINFSWFLYIDVKHHCFPKSSQFMMKKLLMISVLQTIILNSLAHISPLILQKNSPKKYNLNFALQKKEIMSTILEILLKEAAISPSQIIDYQEIGSVFDSYFDSLVSSGLIKSFSEQSFDFLCQRSLDANFRKIDRKISKQIESNQIDLRRLISYELTLQKDHKKTAIEDKLIVKHKKVLKSKVANLQPAKTYKSHRILNLDNYDIEMSSSSVITESEISFPSNIVLEPSMKMSVQGLHIVTEKDQLERFLIEKTRQYIMDVRQYEPSIMSFIQSTFHALSERYSQSNNRKSITQTKNQNVFQAYEFYTYLSQQVWLSDEDHPRYILEQSESTHECLLIIAMGTVLLCQSEKDSSSLIRLMTQVQPDMMDFFYTLIFVKQMEIPFRLKNSLQSVMKTLINEHIWSDKNFIEEISDVTENFNELYEQNQGKIALSCILQRIAQHVSEKTEFIKNYLSKQFSPYGSSQLKQWRKKSLQLALSFVVYCPEIFYQRLLDQIILCSMYGTSKLLQMPVRFHELIQAYKQSVANKSHLVEKTVLSIKNNFSQIETDIIGFYNTEFIGYLNYAFDTVGDRQKMGLVFELCGEFCDGDAYTSPFKYVQQAIILSPKLKKSKSQTNYLKGLQRTLQKQNFDDNTSHSININLDHSGQVGLVSYISEQHPSQLNSSRSQGKIYINLEINQANSRNPTRIKQRKAIESRENELCATQKGKHPIFTELREIDEE